MKILVIEDSVEIQEAIEFIFDLHWNQCTMLRAMNGMEGIRKTEVEKPDLIILDLGLPDIDGLRVLKEVRDFSDVPIIISTVRGEEMDKIRGLELGADDFIVKPFTHKQLIPRVRSVMTRSKSSAKAVNLQEDVFVSDFSIDFSQKILYKNGGQIKLTPTETGILQCLSDNKGSFVKSQDILSNIWGEEYMDCKDYLAVHIERLRAKVEDNPNSPKIIVDDGENSYKLVIL
jgi:two-component system KDP operon response regulator KdpE